MGGRVWSALEEDTFWKKIIPNSPKRLGVSRSNPEKTWQELSEMMTRLMGADARREYTALSLFEHYFQNAEKRRISPNARHLVNNYLRQRDGSHAKNKKNIGKKGEASKKDSAKNGAPPRAGNRTPHSVAGKKTDVSSPASPLSDVSPAKSDRGFDMSLAPGGGYAPQTPASHHRSGSAWYQPPEARQHSYSGYSPAPQQRHGSTPYSSAPFSPDNSSGRSQQASTRASSTDSRGSYNSVPSPIPTAPFPPPANGYSDLPPPFSERRTGHMYSPTRVSVTESRGSYNLPPFAQLNSLVHASTIHSAQGTTQLPPLSLPTAPFELYNRQQGYHDGRGAAYHYGFVTHDDDRLSTGQSTIGCQSYTNYANPYGNRHGRQDQPQVPIAPMHESSEHANELVKELVKVRVGGAGKGTDDNKENEDGLFVS
ncbi:hypothetical protein B0T22DRAFT_220404 [Podospora appendiculata]|uniref:Uncharacterized protein n=1 Tax=Podospora appendiculata TaxID=314037 RepID=A0AAE0X5M9_9PEZI|nr:hypothetical protein B0T22DRAFT_220404 [Podospora appendiculata]